MAIDELRLPGIPNLHSHAFQRAMAGLTERRTNPADSFWTWRELMYRFAARITPESLHAIASQLYVEMLEAGYTTVCEFHYLHHQPNGKPYADPSAMSQALIQAARDAGIRLTLLPVLYMTGGFDGRALGERQRRFGHSVDSFLALVQRLRAQEHDALKIGVALHSLRAVPEMPMREVLAALATHRMPIHIHIAEQAAEVEECVARHGVRPVDWLLSHADVDSDWTLVHATHLTDIEVQRVATSGATVAICPTTEANLGDGLFPLGKFIAADGRFGIGSDSNTSVSPVEELRWLEYGQRLVERQRNIAVDAREASVGALLLAHAVGDGRRSCQQPAAAADDVLILDPRAPALTGAIPENLQDRFVFAGNRRLICDVIVAGRKVVENGRHPQAEPVAEAYRRKLKQLLADA
jgi:formimidoylglutamate deiminase